MITNKQFEEALAVSDNKKIITSACKRYRKILTNDILRRCGLIGLWKCLQKHSNQYQRKFTTSLYTFVDWECKRECQLQFGGHKHKQLPKDMPDLDANTIVYELMDGLDDDEQRIIHQRFFEKMTLEEIGHANGYTKESARTKINRTLKKLKKIYQAGV